jgi:cytochrome c oxidase assembly protein subunit 15
LLAAAAVQIALGIATLLLVVPAALAAAHQTGALVVFTIALTLNHSMQDLEAMPPARHQSAAGRG